MSIPVITAVNSLKENVTFLKTTNSSKFYSSKLLNYVEPVDISGFRKTVFYSEINTNFNVGDRVFILNGNYDSNDFISQDKYTKYTDGYRVLGVDGCRIILDLDYTGELPYDDASLDNFIKVYHVRNQREFDYINSIKVVIPPISVVNSVGSIIGGVQNNIYNSKFSGNTFNIDLSSLTQSCVLYSDSIIYVDDNFVGSNDLLITNTGITNEGFYVRNPSSFGGIWIDISTQVKENRIVSLNPNHSLNGQLYISGEDINDTTHTGNLFKQRNFYNFKDGNWIINTNFKKPVISKLNFRYGNFKGKHNDGIFGTNIKRNNWNSAIWNSGVFVNSTWNSGTMNSKSQLGEQLFNATLKKIPGTTYSIPAQTIDFSNNRGFGHNFVFDSIYNSGILNNGNFENCNFGTSSTFSAVDIYFGLTHSFNLSIKGQLNLCDINSAQISNATIVNNEVNNSLITNSKIVNSQVSQSSIDKSEITDSNGIKVLAADVWSYSYFLSSNSVRGILKLYISDDDLNKINLGNAFYISRINKEFVLNNLTDYFKVKLPLEAKYILDYYFNTELTANQVVSNQLSVSLKNKNDNKKRIESYAIIALSPFNFSIFGNVFSDNNINYASIDIECRDFGFYKSNLSLGKNILVGGSNNLLYSFIKDPISQELSTNIEKVFTNTYLHNSDIKSGSVNNSNWSSSDNINYIHNKINRIGNKLDINVQTSDTISVNLPLSTKMNTSIQIPGEDMFINDNVWINSINFQDGINNFKIDGRYKVTTIVTTPQQEIVYLKNLDGLVFSSSGTFSVIDGETANYTSINKMLINNSKVGKGLFVRTGFRNSTFFDSEFDNTDRNLNTENNSKQRFVNITFKNTNNDIKSGLVYASHFINDTWSNGILYNSIWNGGTFNNGVAKSNYWLNGTFNNGIFLDSFLTYSTTPTMVVSNNNSIINQYSFNIGQLRKLWFDGTFNLGEFYNSVWSKGQFNNGKFYSSNWYSGTWSNGVLGNKNLPLQSTKFGYDLPLTISNTQSVWLNGVVDNAIIGGQGNVHWYYGKFNNGEFTNFSTQSVAIWYDGDFNGGQFSNLAKWKNGNFFKGNFTSYFGYESVNPVSPSTSQQDYGWENGKFYGGVFGNQNLGTNSTWFNGEFRGGQFVGRFWYDGIFYKGDFLGSGTHSFYSSDTSSLGEFSFANSYTQSYYGLWFGGHVIDVPQNVKTDERVFTKLVRKVDEKKEDNKVELKNMLWINGTFSHKNGAFISSMWLNGQFNDGKFNSSIFNPYVDRQFTGSFTNSSFELLNSCIWNNGEFISDYGTGSFYISEWKYGTFNRGYMSGGIWRDGIWYYGTADNIYWTNGLWKNGNWNGSPFDYTQMATMSSGQYQMIDGRHKDILLNLNNEIGSNKIHINNAFSASNVGSQILTDVKVTKINIENSTPSPTASLIYDNTETYYGISSVNNGFQSFQYIPISIAQNINFVYANLGCSDWNYDTSFALEPYSGNINAPISNDTHVYTTGGTPQVGYNPALFYYDGYNPKDFFNPPQSSKLYITLANANKNVFANSSATYEIKIKLSVELQPQVYVEFGIGSNNPLLFTFSSDGIVNYGNRPTEHYYPKAYDVSFVYNTPGNLTPSDQKIWIRKKDGGILRILNVSISENKTEYHPLYNNVLYSSIQTNNDVLFPTDPRFTPIGASDTGNIVSINFGNGSFRTGIWENGVWNNGYRSNEWFNELDYFRFSDVVGSFITLQNGQILTSSPSYNDNFTYKFDEYTWNICLQGIDSVANFNVGDKVSIGNIVAIDVNEERIVIKDYFRITKINISDNTINVDLITNFPVRRVERDSDKHLIYVTKNIWLSGAFLNGFFRGIWNNGLVKGFPKITEIRDTHFVTGKFDGGRFVSRQSLTGYNTGLVQSFDFIDNNISGLVKSAQLINDWKKYISWMDVNYLGNTASTTNLNQDATSLNVQENEDPNNPGSVSAYANFYNSDNLKGSITYDILDSKSSFRNAYTLDIKDYKLGMKYKKYDNLTPNDGNFTRALTNTYQNLNLINNINFGVNRLSLDGWTYSYWKQPYSSWSIYGGPEVESNINVSTLNNLHLTITQSYIYSQGSMNDSYISLGQFKFINSEIETLSSRYYITELDLATISYITGTGTNGWNDVTSIFSQFSPSLETKLKLNTEVNELFTEGLIKRQYFYNIQELKMEYNSFSFLYNSPSSSIDDVIPEKLEMYINNFSLIEVDKIPFFKYADETDIDNRVKTPYYATAPFIDYTNSNFDFIGNVNLTFESQGIIPQGVASNNINVNSSSSVNGTYLVDIGYTSRSQTS